MKRLAIYVAVIAVTIAALVLAWQFRSVLILLLLSLMVAAALRPSAEFLMARGVRESLAWLLVYLGLFGSIALALFFLSGRLLNELQLLSNYLVVIYDSTFQRWSASDGLLNAVAQRLPPPDRLPEVLAGPSGLSILRLLFGVTQSAVAVLAGLVIIVVLSLYWSSDRAHFERLWLSLLPANQRVEARSIWRQTEASIGAYLRSEFVQSVLAVAMLAVAYNLLGIDYPILAALLAGLAWIIPMAGFVFAAGLSFLAGLASTGAYDVALLTMLVTAAVLAFLEFVVEPRFFQRNEFSGLLIVLMVLIMVEAYGLIGFVIAPPLAVALQVLVGHVVRYMQQPRTPAVEIETLESRLATIHAAWDERERVAEQPSPEVGSLLQRLADLVAEARRVSP